jgi:hypothetical protein
MSPCPCVPILEKRLRTIRIPQTGCVPILEKRLKTIRIPQTGNSLKEGRLYGGCKRKPKF